MPLQELSHLAKYLSAEEKSYLSKRLFFKEETASQPPPPGLNTNSTPRKLEAFPPEIEMYTHPIYIDPMQLVSMYNPI